MLNIDYDGTLDLQRYQNWKKKNHELARIANIPRTAPDAVWTGDGTVGGGTDPGQQPASQRACGTDDGTCEGITRNR